MRVKQQRYEHSGHATVSIVDNNGKTIIAESGDCPETAMIRLKSRLLRIVEFGREAEILLRELVNNYDL